MCGRFVGFSDLEHLKAFFPIDKAACDITASYNVAPSHKVFAIVNRDGENCLEKFHWGLVPFWAKDISVGNRMINARAETVATKPSFRNAFKKQRCLILADGFYEWKGKKGQKQPMFITLPEGNPFAFAGLWETWNKTDDSNSLYKSCAIITTNASESVREIHHRMPVILQPEVYEAWLDPENHDVVVLENILTNGFITELAAHPVSKQVNSVRHNDPSNIGPLTQMPLDF
jgi:putative SOS response-associated peptidase YedK